MKSFEILYQKHLGDIYNFILQIVKDANVAEEITSDVFVQLWKTSKKEEISNPLGLLITISKNLSFNYLKSVSRNRIKTEEFIKRYSELYSGQKESQNFYSHRSKILEQLVESMPPKRKCIFEMKYFKEMSLRNIAKELNISVNTVQNHLTKGKSELKKSILSGKFSDLIHVISILIIHSVH